MKYSVIRKAINSVNKLTHRFNHPAISAYEYPAINTLDYLRLVYSTYHYVKELQ